MSDVSDEENEFTEDPTEYTEGGEENDEIKLRKSVGEENEESESEEENEGDEEIEDEDGSEGGEENEENNSTNEGAEDGEAVVFPTDIDIEVDGNTREVVKKLTMKEKFNDMERKKILIISLIFSLMVALPSGLGIGLGTSPLPDYCSYPKFKACRENGKCVTVSGLAECECNEGWTGELCKMQDCEHPEACNDVNTATCAFTDKRGVTCHCKSGFTGEKCDDEIDLCSKGDYTTCSNHGTCDDNKGYAECACDDGWAGQFCEMPTCANPDACNTVNTESCTENRGVACICKAGFTGQKCEQSEPTLCKDEYANCNNHGTCAMVDGLPKCTCDPEWTGVTCSGKSCDKPGVCVDAHTIDCDDSDGYAICNCYSGYIGVDCAFDQTGGGMG